MKNPGTSSNSDAGDASGCSAAETGAAGYGQAIITRPVYRGSELQRNIHHAPHMNFKLSEDVLRYIFYWCSAGCLKLPFPFPKLPFSVVLTHVCALWRRVALDTPELWNSIWLDFQCIEEPHVQELLLRAKRFRITLRMGREIDDHHLNLLVPDILNSYHIRWLEVMVTCRQLLTFLSGVRNETVEHLSLSCGPCDNTYIPEELDQSPHSPFPNLKSLYFSSVYHRLKFDWPQYFDWDRLCDLSLEAVPSKIWEILRRVAALESLTITFWESDEDEDYCHSAETIIFPHLTSLSIELLEFEQPCKILYFLRHPNLEELHIRGCDMIWDGETFSHLARQSNFNKLQKLEFDEDIVTLNNLQVDRLLDDLPNLRELSVPVGTEIDRNTLMKLTDGRLGKYLMTLVVGDVELYSQRFESITIGD